MSGTAAPGRDWLGILARPTAESFADAFTADVALDASVASAPVVGPSALRIFFGATRSMFDSIAFTRETAGEEATFLDWTAVYRGEPMTGVTILESGEEGRIRRVRTFYGPMSQALAFSKDLAARLAS